MMPDPEQLDFEEELRKLATAIVALEAHQSA
jgi:hypothetical protein